MAYHDGPKKNKIIRLPSRYIIPTHSYNVSGWASYRYLAEEADVDMSCFMLPVKMLVAMYAYVYRIEQREVNNTETPCTKQYLRQLCKQQA